MSIETTKRLSDGPGGERFQESTGTANRREAEKFLALAHLSGPYVFYNPMTGDKFKDVRGAIAAAATRAGLGISTTMRYAHSNDESKRRAVQRLKSSDKTVAIAPRTTKIAV